MLTDDDFPWALAITPKYPDREILAPPDSITGLGFAIEYVSLTLSFKGQPVFVVHCVAAPDMDVYSNIYSMYMNVEHGRSNPLAQFVEDANRGHQAREADSKALMEEP